MSNLIHWLENCKVCPNFCNVNRLENKKGRCRSGYQVKVSSFNLHFGEESVLVGTGGSGTIFFTCCNLKCVFCQNYDISQLDSGEVISPEDLVAIMITLQLKGAENINLVSPTHQAPQIFEALKKAKLKGLRLPVVYNCGGYENPEFLRELDGLVDIYMPDFKYGSDLMGEKYSGITSYTGYCKSSLIEMHRQVGDLKLNSRNVAERGLLVRHLVLPEGIAVSRNVIDFISESISLNTFINIMDQYRPNYRASEYREIRRRVYYSEVEEVVMYAREKGLARILY